MGDFSSRDFGSVPSSLTAILPARLHQKDVQKTGASQSFSEIRKHGVHIVDLPSVSISMTLGTLAPGQRTGLHRHNYETLMYVISGCGVTRIGDRTIEWTEGDAIYIPSWAKHSHQSREVSEMCTYVACENAPLLQNLGGIALREELEE